MIERPHRDVWKTTILQLGALGDGSGLLRPPVRPVSEEWFVAEQTVQSEWMISDAENVSQSQLLRFEVFFILCSDKILSLTLYVCYLRRWFLYLFFVLSFGCAIQILFKNIRMLFKWKLTTTKKNYNKNNNDWPLSRLLLFVWLIYVPIFDGGIFRDGSKRMLSKINQAYLQWTRIRRI